jgi:hypothetical protein
MAFDVTKFGQTPPPNTQYWGTALAVPGSGAGPTVRPTPYAFDGTKAPGKNPKKPKEPTATKTTTAAAPGKTAAQKAAEKKAAAKKAAAKKAAEKKAAAAAAAAAERNPLTSSFKTPNELRAEAARLAAMGSASEESLRSSAAQQQAGIGGLTSALTGTLTGIADRTQTGLAGFGSLYSNLAGQAQSAGQSAAAAAGAPTTIAAGASPAVASNLANLAAPTMGYAPAAAVTGAQMQGSVATNLTKALADRAT